MIDFNDDATQTCAGREFDGYALIPDGMVVIAKVSLWPVREGGVIHTSKVDNSVTYLKVVYTVVDEEYMNRRVYDNVGISGGDRFVKIGRNKIKAILSSYTGYDMNDMSDEAKASRRIESYDDLTGLSVQIKVGIELSGSLKYPAQNKLTKIFTPADVEYLPLGKALIKPRYGFNDD